MLCCSLDGTEETGYLGRLVNHSRTSNNLATKSVAVHGRPHLILVAKRDILPGSELLYDYGDRYVLQTMCYTYTTDAGKLLSGNFAT